MSNGLVNRLSFVRQLNIERLCKDCIFGKHITHKDQHHVMTQRLQSRSIRKILYQDNIRELNSIPSINQSILYIIDHDLYTYHSTLLQSTYICHKISMLLLYYIISFVLNPFMFFFILCNLVTMAVTSLLPLLLSSKIRIK